MTDSTTLAMDATEDEVRDFVNATLHLENGDGHRGGVGQITTFNQLGITGVVDKPDGWWIPDVKTDPALILETKAAKVDIGTAKVVAEVKKNCRILLDAGYERVFGLVTNGRKCLGFKNNQPVDVPDEVQDVSWYLGKFYEDGLDRDFIYKTTMKINNCLHGSFGVKNLYHRMVFTACALVARRYGCNLVAAATGGWTTFQSSIRNALNTAFIRAKNQNVKLDLLLEVFGEIKMNLNVNAEDAKEQAKVTELLGEFAGWVTDIGDCINSSEFSGEDVMSIFFNEFNRYKKKAESGQVFTPEHVAELMYKLAGCDADSIIVDTTCGSGTFLVKAMSLMMREAGGPDTAKAAAIKANQLYGIEFDREIFALVCANMLLHKDGKTNLAQGDTRSEWACEWLREKVGNKHGVVVLENPPYERKFGSLQIVANTLDNVPKGSKALFILPDRKFEKDSKKLVREIFDRHHLDMVVKLPDDLFFGVGVTTSVFMFTTGRPQNGDEFYAARIADDGFVVVKNQGRHDVHDRWPAIEEAALDYIRKRKVGGEFGGMWVTPDVGSQTGLCWQEPEKPFSISEEDFTRTAMDYLLFQRGVCVSDLRKALADEALYGIGHLGMEVDG